MAWGLRPLRLTLVPLNAFDFQTEYITTKTVLRFGEKRRMATLVWSRHNRVGAKSSVRIPTNLDTHSDPNWTLFRDSWTVVGAKRRSGLMVNRVSKLGQGFCGSNGSGSQPQATSWPLVSQGEPSGSSPNGVAPTGAGLSNHSSRLLSCAWVPFGGDPEGGRIALDARSVNPKDFCPV